MNVTMRLDAQPEATVEDAVSDAVNISLNTGIPVALHIDGEILLYEYKDNTSVGRAKADLVEVFQDLKDASTDVKPVKAKPNVQ